MPKEKFIRKCPKCKSTKGFEVTYNIGGDGMEIRDFKGNVKDAERSVTDMDNHITCLDCGANLDEYNVQL